MQERRNWAWRFAEPIVRGALVATTIPEWVGGENIPESGGCIIALNHVSYVDPLLSAHLVYDHGRLPHYLAKSGLFKNRALSYFLRAAGQIPVERLSRNAAGAFDAAVAAVHEGKCVVVYPEGTITRDPDGWPMTGKSGAARIALETGCPVIPVGQWGAQQLLAPYAKRPDLFPRKRVTMRVGEALDLSDLAAQPRTAQVIQQTTDRIMAAVTALVEEVRGEQAPPERFDMRKAGVRQTGNPNKPERHRNQIPGEDPS